MRVIAPRQLANRETVCKAGHARQWSSVEQPRSARGYFGQLPVATEQAKYDLLNGHVFVVMVENQLRIFTHRLIGYRTTAVICK